MFLSSGPNNLTERERSTLRELQNLEDVVTKPAHNGGLIILQSRDNYLSKGLRQIADPKYYTLLKHDLTMDQED